MKIRKEYYHKLRKNLFSQLQYYSIVLLSVINNKYHVKNTYSQTYRTNFEWLSALSVSRSFRRRRRRRIIVAVSPILNVQTRRGKFLDTILQRVFTCRRTIIFFSNIYRVKAAVYAWLSTLRLHRTLILKTHPEMVVERINLLFC